MLAPRYNVKFRLLFLVTQSSAAGDLHGDCSTLRLCYKWYPFGMIQMIRAAGTRVYPLRRGFSYAALIRQDLKIILNAVPMTYWGRLNFFQQSAASHGGGGSLD